jgi:hypothetical protein
MEVDLLIINISDGSRNFEGGEGHPEEELISVILGLKSWVFLTLVCKFPGGGLPLNLSLNRVASNLHNTEPVLLNDLRLRSIFFCSLLSNLGQFENGFNRFKKNLDRYISVRILVGRSERGNNQIFLFRPNRKFFSKTGPCWCFPGFISDSLIIYRNNFQSPIFPHFVPFVLICCEIGFKAPSINQV